MTNPKLCCSPFIWDLLSLTLGEECRQTKELDKQDELTSSSSLIMTAQSYIWAESTWKVIYTLDEYTWVVSWYWALCCHHKAAPRTWTSCRLKTAELRPCCTTHSWQKYFIDLSYCFQTIVLWKWCLCFHSMFFLVSRSYFFWPVNQVPANITEGQRSQRYYVPESLKVKRATLISPLRARLQCETVLLIIK